MFAIPFSWDLPLLILATGVIFQTANKSQGASQKLCSTDIAVALFVLASSVSTFASGDLARSALGIVALVPATLVYVTISRTFSADDVRLLGPSTVCLVILVAMSVIAPWLVDTSGDPTVWVSKASQVIAVPNDVLVLSVLNPVLLGVIYSARGKLLQSGAIVAVALSFIAIVLARSRIALIALLVGHAITLWCLRRHRFLLVTFVLVIVAACLDLLLGGFLIGKIVKPAAEGRAALWWSAWQMLLDSPYLGKGPNMFGVYYPEFVTAFPETDFFVVDERYVPWPHNMYLEALAERGAIGFVTLLAMLVTGTHLAFRARARGNERTRTYAGALLGSLMVIAIAGGFELTFLHLWVPIISFALLGTGAAISRLQVTSGGK